MDRGGSIPTLNAFDVGDGREVVLIIDGTRVDDVRVYEDEIMQTVIGRWGTGGGNVPAIAYSFDSLSSNSMKSSNPNSGCNVVDIAKTIDTAALNPSANQGGMAIVSEPIVMRDREGKPGGGKGPLTSTTAFTLSTSNFHTLFPSSSTVRRLTPTECERLQGFPDGWTEGQADSSRYKQMGNAVAVPVVNFIIERLVKGM